MDPYVASFDYQFFVLYGAASFAAVMASIYLLFRRANAFSPHITPPVRLRRAAAAFLASLALSHIWWLLLYYIQPAENHHFGAVFCSVADLVVTFPAMMITLMAMLQDKRRSWWAVAAYVVFIVAWITVWYVYPFNSLFFMLVSCLSLFAFIGITMVVYLRQYGRWLRENYADLEHKEVWQSYLVIGAMALPIAFYNLAASSITIEKLLQLFVILLIFVLLWRVETLQELSSPVTAPAVDVDAAAEATDAQGSSESVYAKIEAKLQQQSRDYQFYLKHDISLHQLSLLIGTNKTYLSNYFAQQGITYNTYINRLRIQYFVRLYQNSGDAVALTARQLAFMSGYHSYSTFSNVFKQIMGQTVTAWMNDQKKVASMKTT